MPLNTETTIRTGRREPGPIRFSLAFPLGQLVLCAILLWPIRAWVFMELGVPGPLLGDISLPYEGIVARPLRIGSPHQTVQVVALLNLPAGMLQLPYAIFSPDHNDLHPRRVDLAVWRAATWPILGIFFWWVAGRGADALAASRRGMSLPKIRWAEAFLGFLLAVLSVTATIGLVFFSGADRHDLLLQLTAIVGVLWTVLGALPFVAKIMQLHLSKKLAAIPPPAVLTHQ